MRQRFPSGVAQRAQGGRRVAQLDHPGLPRVRPAEGTKEGELLADAKESDVKQLVESRSGSHLFEAIIRAARSGCTRRDFPAIFPREDARRRGHPTANFVLQALFGATRDGDHVNTALQELGPDFRLAASRTPRRRRRRRPRRVRAPPLRRGEPRKISPGDSPRRWRRGRRSIAARARAAVDGPAQWFRGGRCSVLGAAMLQTLLKFRPMSYRTSRSTASLTRESDRRRATRGLPRARGVPRQPGTNPR